MVEGTHDVTVLRAISHPVRNRILHELYAVGTARAADLASDLGIPANQASFHLRQLAKYGLIEPAPEAARDGRDRVWRPVDPEGTNLDLGAIEQTPGGKAASTVFRRSQADFAHAAVDRAFSDRRPKGTTQSVIESSLRLTKDEAVELSAELDRTVKDWTERTRGRDASRRTYLVLQLVQPYPEAD